MNRRFFHLFLLLAFSLNILLGCTGVPQGSEKELTSDPVMDVEVPEDLKKVISVRNFEDRSIGTSKFNPWKMGIPDMVMESLSTIPYFKVVSREYMQTQVLDEQEFQLLGLTDDSTAVEIGKILNADYIVTGAFSVFEETLQVNATCISVKTGEVVSQAQSRGELRSFYVVQNQVAVQIAENMNLYISEDARESLLARAETTVLEASLANYAGEAKLEEIAVIEKTGNRKRVEEVKESAKEDFERALSYDKTYEKAKRNLAKLVLAIPMTL
jgi:TolB-like protein